MPKRKEGDGLANEELSLKEKYALMRAKKENPQDKEKDAKAKLEAEKMERAKKVLAASLMTKEKEEEVKKPVRSVSLTKKLTEMKERGITPEPKRAKVEPTENMEKPRMPEDSRMREERRARERAERDNMNQPHPYFYREKPTQYPKRDEPVEMTDDGEYYPTTVFVGDLTDEVTLPELENAFARFGEIDSLRPVAGKNFVFIKFKNREASLRSIVEMNGFVINNVRLRVHRAKVPAVKGRWAGRGGRRNDNEVPPAAEEGRPNQVPPPPPAPEAEVRAVEYNPNKFIPKIPKMNITPELQEQQQMLNSRTLRNYDDL